MLSINFNGWFQCRLATDPDPWDETRGSSGWTFAFPGEPDLDRIIRFENPVSPRTHGPTIGVKVSKVSVDNNEDQHHLLLGAKVTLLENPVFEGRNGIIASSAKEPILPFVLLVGTEQLSITKRDEIDITDPIDKKRRQPLGLEINSATVARATGISNHQNYRLTRKQALVADLQIEQDPLRKEQLLNRIAEIEDVPRRGDIRVDSLGFRVQYSFEIAGVGFLDDPQRLLNVTIDFNRAWPINFWMGAWDADAMCGYVDGQIEIAMS